MLKQFLLLSALLLAAPATAETQMPLQQQAEALLVEPRGTRYGLLIVGEDGREIVAIDPDGRFIPASNTKIFSTAAAYALLPGIDRPDLAGGTQVSLRPGKRKSAPDVWLSGRGDARMSAAPDCTVDCLAALADAVAAKTRLVGDVIGDDSFWPDQRWSPGMSWNNIGTDSGTAASALNLDDNELLVTARPGALGKPPLVTLTPYFTLRNEAVTVAAGGKIALRLERAVNGMELRLYGTIPADAAGWSDRLGIDDPAHYAAWNLERMLQVRGVRVTGKVRVNHRAVQLYDLPEGPPAPVAAGYPALAILTPPPLAEDVAIINKTSQNLHAQALFRRVGDIAGTGSEQWAAQALKDLLERSGVPRLGYDFADGSGMSTYNRASPRATVALLRWIAAQPWGEQWYASLPVAGQEGSLRGRFGGTLLAGNLTAKTGAINATAALSGRFRAKSGELLTFALFANDVPDGANARAALDAALVALAEAL